MSGHSKWSTIKRQKGAADAKRGQLFTKLAREITVAARNGGGDPDSNPTLRLAVQKAKDNNMPVDNIERAIKRAVESKESGALEEMTLEGYSPGGAALLLQILTDNRNRTLSEVRSTFTKHNASLGEAGCVTWIFEAKGIITMELNSDYSEELELAAIDAGADDIKAEGDIIEIYSTPGDLEKVRRFLEDSGITIASADIALIPQNMVKLEDKAALQTLKLIDKLEEIDGVQQVYTNADFSDETLDQYRSQ